MSWLPAVAHADECRGQRCVRRIVDEIDRVDADPVGLGWTRCPFASETLIELAAEEGIDSVRADRGRRGPAEAVEAQADGLGVARRRVQCAAGRILHDGVAVLP